MAENGSTGGDKNPESWDDRDTTDRFRLNKEETSKEVWERLIWIIGRQAYAGVNVSSVVDILRRFLMDEA